MRACPQIAKTAQDWWLRSNSAKPTDADNSATPPPIILTELYENNTTQGIERPLQPRGDRNRLTEYPKGDLGRK